ncbi:hypothetical protein JCM14469_40120 [Desulfatiferula olefinivorans]
MFLEPYLAFRKCQNIGQTPVIKVTGHSEPPVKSARRGVTALTHQKKMGINGRTQEILLGVNLFIGISKGIGIKGRAMGHHRSLHGTTTIGYRFTGCQQA